MEQWIERFKEQAESGMTVKDWCNANNLTIHSYNYWKHLLKQEYVNSVLPDIVPVTSPMLTAPIQDQPQQIFAPASRDSHDAGSIQLSVGGISITAPLSISKYSTTSTFLIITFHETIIPKTLLPIARLVQLVKSAQ